MIEEIKFNKKGNEFIITPLYASPTIIVGANGGGKTSLLECILSHHKGDYKCLNNVEITYSGNQPIICDLEFQGQHIDTYKNNLKKLVLRIKKHQKRLAEYNNDDLKKTMEEMVKYFEMPFYRSTPLSFYLAQRMEIDYKKTCVSMIDCPDQGLHMCNQDELALLLKLLFPNDQFIFVTHSPVFIPNSFNNVVCI